jgi:hypothetical protein
MDMDCRRYDRFAVEEKRLSLLRVEPRSLCFPARWLVTIPTQAFRTQVFVVICGTVAAFLWRD